MTKKSFKAVIITFIMLAMIISCFYYVIIHCGTIEGILNLIFGWFSISIVMSVFQTFINAVKDYLRKEENHVE